MSKKCDSDCDGDGNDDDDYREEDERSHQHAMHLHSHVYSKRITTFNFMNENICWASQGTGNRLCHKPMTSRPPPSESQASKHWILQLS